MPHIHCGYTDFLMQLSKREKNKYHKLVMYTSNNACNRTMKTNVQQKLEHPIIPHDYDLCQPLSWMISCHMTTLIVNCCVQLSMQEQSYSIANIGQSSHSQRSYQCQLYLMCLLITTRTNQVREYNR